MIKEKRANKLQANLSTLIMVEIVVDFSMFVRLTFMIYKKSK
jgi:hypothetical protein